MPVVKAMVTLQGKSGDPKDRYVNTWHWNVGDGAEGSAEFPDIFDKLKDFYGTDTEQVTNQQPAGERNVMEYLGDHIAAGQVHTVKIYNLDDPKPRQPVFTGLFNKPDNGRTKLPAEVAVVLSLRADVPGGQNVQRGRGRIYVGPLNILAMGSNTNDARVTANFRNVLAKALIRLHSTMDLVIHSEGARAVDPATGRRATGALLAPVAYSVEAGFVDDAFDTQRRRGNASTARTLILGG